MGRQATDVHSEKEEQVGVTNWLIKTEILDIPTEFDADRFHAALDGALKARDLASTMAFYREGLNDLRDLRDLRYINAFFNFYFVLEGMYSGGKWKTDAVKSEFKKSKVLEDANQPCDPEGYSAAVETRSA